MQKGQPRNDDEKAAKRYLDFIGLNCVFEPDGNATPDFATADKEIGIEVRRLNRTLSSGGEVIGIESLEHYISGMVRGLLRGFGAANGEKSYFVSIKVPRAPKADTTEWRRELKKKVNVELHKIREQLPPGKTERVISDCLVLKFIELPNTQKFAFGISSVGPAYMAVSTISENILRCSDEKLQKISKKKACYKNWWLVLINHIGGSIGEDERTALRDICTFDGWEKIIIVDPVAVGNSFEIGSNRICLPA